MTGAAEFSGAHSWMPLPGWCSGSSRALAEGTTTAQTSESELSCGGGTYCGLLPARGRRRRRGRGRQRASRSQSFLLSPPGVQVHHRTCHRRMVTPLIWWEWKEELVAQPDTEFRDYILNGIANGFRVGFNPAVNI